MMEEKENGEDKDDFDTASSVEEMSSKQNKVLQS